MFRWRSGGYPVKTFEAPDVEEIREKVREYVREASQRGAQPRCGHCGEPIQEESEESLARHTMYEAPADDPACESLAKLATLVLGDSC